MGNRGEHGWENRYGELGRDAGPACGKTDGPAHLGAVAAPSKARIMGPTETDLMASFLTATPDAFSFRVAVVRLPLSEYSLFILLSYCPTLVGI